MLLSAVSLTKKETMLLWFESFKFCHTGNERGFMKSYTMISIPGLDNNEDAAFVSSQMGYVLDGATGLLKEKITPAGSDATWFSYTWSEYLHKHLSDEKRSITQIVKQGITEINNLYMSMEGAGQVKSKPSAGAAMFRIVRDKIELFILGDVSIFLMDKEGNFTHFALTDLPKLDEMNINRMVNIAKEKNIDVIEARPFITDTLVEVRNRQNKPGGYWILSDNPEAADKAFTAEINKDNIKTIVVMSDGFSQIFDTLNIYTKQELASRLISGECLETMCRKIKTVQEEDALCNRYPRFKKSDDLSVIKLEL